MLLGNLQHRAELRGADDGGPMTFRWHWPRGTFDKRMSALELSSFVITHMPAVLFYLEGRAKEQFALLLQKITQTPPEKLDEVVPWIRSLIKTSDDDMIIMSLDAKELPPEAALIFDMGQ